MLPRQWRGLGVAALLGGTILVAAAADRRMTVCTITINSADEKAALARNLPATRFRFVELVQPGSADWLRAACRAGTACDVLLISGHYDGDNEFFSDEPEDAASLRISELERAACSGGCAGLFGRLKEVYLLGCNTLSPRALSAAASDTVRTTVRERETRGASPRGLEWPAAVHGESSRERMRQIFSSAPVIYGFPSLAPLGSRAAASLERYLRTGGHRAFGRGHADLRLLEQFASAGLTAAQGASGNGAAEGWDVCRFVDERLPDAQVVRHLHRLLRRDMSLVRTHLDRLQRIAAGITARMPRPPALAAALGELADDFISRLNFLEAARSADEPQVRAGMLRLARDLGWLTPAELHGELGRLLAEMHARPEPGLGELALACSLGAAGDLDGAWRAETSAAALSAGSDTLTHVALRACLGHGASRSRILAALVSAAEADVQLAHVYLRHRPLTDRAEMARVVREIVSAPTSATQARALAALGRPEIAEAGTVDALARLYAETSSEEVQVAVAGLLLRVERSLLEPARLLPVLTGRRVRPGAAGTLVDALIARLQS